MVTGPLRVQQPLLALCPPADHQLPGSTTLGGRRGEGGCFKGRHLWSLQGLWAEWGLWAGTQAWQGPFRDWEEEAEKNRLREGASAKQAAGFLGIGKLCFVLGEPAAPGAAAAAATKSPSHLLFIYLCKYLYSRFLPGAARYGTVPNSCCQLL